VAWGLILIHIFEAPPWTFKFDNAADQSLFPGYGLPFLSVTASCLLNMLLVLILLVGCCLEHVFEVSHTRRTLLAIMVVSASMKFTESFVSLCLFAAGRPPISLSPCEALLIVLVERQYHSNIPYLIRVLPPFAILIMVLAAVICTYTAFGYLIFDPGSLEMKQFFGTYGDAIWNLLMVLDGSNWPTPMMPAYNQNRLYCLYFIVYLVVGNWGLLNLTLGFIFTSFQIELQRIAEFKQDTKHANLTRAFHVLDTDKKGYLRSSEIELVIEYLYRNFEAHVIQSPSVDERLDLVADLASSRDGKVFLDDFLRIRERCFEGSLGKLRARTHIDRYFSVASLSSVVQSMSFSFHSSFKLNSRTQSTESQRNQMRDFASGDFVATDVLSPMRDSNKAEHVENGGRISANLLASTEPVKLPKAMDDVAGICRVDDQAMHQLRRLRCSDTEAHKPKKMTIQEVWAMPRPATVYETVVFVARIIDSIFYDILMDSLVVFFGLVLFLSNSVAVYYFLVAVCLFESLSKLFVKGLYRFRHSYRNSMTGFLTILLIVCAVIMGSAENKHPFRFAIQTIVVLRFLFYPLNVLVLEKFKNGRRKYLRALRFAVSGAGDFLFLLLVLFVCIYAAAGLGVQLFGGMIRKYGEYYALLQNSLYGQSGYWPMNFNDMLSGMATMFVLLHVNNMHVIASGFSAVISDTALIFFAGWYIIGVLFMLNVVIAFFLTQLITYVTNRDSENEINDSEVAESNTNLVSPTERRPSAILSSIPETEASACSPAGNAAAQEAETETQEVRPSIMSSPPMSKSSNRKKFDKSIFASEGARERLVTMIESNYDDYRQSVTVSAVEAPALKQATNLEGHATVTAMLELEETGVSVKLVLDELKDSNRLHLNSELHSNMKDWVSWRTELAPHEASAVLIQYARDGGHYTLFSTMRALRCFRLRQKYAMLLRVSCWLLLLLKIFERPHWTYFKDDWQSGSYPKSGIYYLSTKAAVGIKLPLLSILLFGLLLEYGYKENGRLTVSYLSPMVVVRYLLMLACLTQCLLLLYIGISGELENLIVVTSLGTSLYVFWFDKRAFVRFKLVLQILPAFSIVLLGFLFLVLFFASMGPFIFHECSTCDDDDFNRSQFETLPDSVWSVFVAITSSSYPGQVMPIYRRSRLFFLYFFFFISLGAYGVMNLCLIVVLYQYNRHAQLHADEVHAAQDILMIRAFQVLDTRSSGYLTYNQVGRVLNELYEHYTDFRKAGVPSESKQHLLMKILDIDGDGRISADDFAYLIDVTRIKLKMDEDDTLFQTHCPALANSGCFTAFADFIKGRLYITAIDVVLVSLMLADLALTPDIYSLHSVKKYYGIKIAALCFLAFNTLATYVVRGHRNFMKYLRNRVDLFIFASYLFVVVGFACTENNAPLYAGIAVYGQLVEIWRVLLFPRVFRTLLPEGSYQLLNVAVRKIIRSVYTLTVVFACTFFAMSNVGVLVFGGKVSTSPTSQNYVALNASQYGINGFWTLNFNDMPSAFVTLFCCLHVSDFDVITSGFVAVTSPWARLYFAAWYVVGVLLLLNIVKSYFLSGNLIDAVKGAMSYKLADWKTASCCCVDYSFREDSSTGLSLAENVDQSVHNQRQSTKAQVPRNVSRSLSSSSILERSSSLKRIKSFPSVDQLGPRTEPYEVFPEVKGQESFSLYHIADDSDIAFESENNDVTNYCPAVEATSCSSRHDLSTPLNDPGSCSS
jgi:Ca2+-binding EF-hand superfamily protein/membrane protein implicated in regulation of membrane protease activity